MYKGDGNTGSWQKRLKGGGQSILHVFPHIRTRGAVDWEVLNLVGVQRGEGGKRAYFSSHV